MNKINMLKSRRKKIIADIIRKFCGSEVKCIFVRGSYAVGYANEFSDIDIGVLIVSKNIKLPPKKFRLDYGNECVHVSWDFLREVKNKLNKQISSSKFLSLARTLLYAKPIYDPNNIIKDLHRRLEKFPSNELVRAVLYKAFSELTDAQAALKRRRYDTTLLNLRFSALTCAMLLVLVEKGYWKEKWLVYELDRFKEKYREEIKLIKEILGLNQDMNKIHRLVLKTTELCLKLEDKFGPPLPPLPATDK